MPKKKSSSAVSQRERGVGGILIAVYLLLRMVADPFFWRSISELYAYGFELVFVMVAYLTFRRRIVLGRAATPRQIAVMLGMLVVGALTELLAPVIGVPIPFDLSAPYTIFLLVLWAPILEEAIFRMALWESFRAAFKSETRAFAATTFLFAAGHFAAYPFVPELYQGFVIYQTAYVLVLGAVAGWQRQQSGALLPAIGVHFAFNLGFFLAWKV